MLETANTYFRRLVARTGKPAWRAVAEQHWHRDEPFDPDADLDAPTAAFVNWGRWVAVCPECPGAQLADDDAAVMVCIDCGCGKHEVLWPEDRAGIEAALLARPDPANRNWVPSETVDDLLDENAEHLPADDGEVEG